MESSEKQYEPIISRIFEKAPGAVILTDPNVTADAFVDDLLTRFGDIFKQESHLPVRVNGADYKDSFSTWKGIASSIKVALDAVFPETMTLKTHWKKIENAPSSMEIKSILQRIFQYVSKNSEWSIILFLEDFEDIMHNMPYSDVFKLREMDSYLALFTISHEHPIQLGEKFFKNDYYCNQFEFFTV